MLMSEQECVCYFQMLFLATNEDKEAIDKKASIGHFVDGFLSISF